jgi:hypothetical protein
MVSWQYRDNVNSLQSLSFSREFEKQADLEGLPL